MVPDRTIYENTLTHGTWKYKGTETGDWTYVYIGTETRDWTWVYTGTETGN